MEAGIHEGSEAVDEEYAVPITVAASDGRLHNDSRVYRNVTGGLNHLKLEIRGVCAIELMAAFGLPHESEFHACATAWMLSIPPTL